MKKTISICLLIVLLSTVISLVHASQPEDELLGTWYFSWWHDSGKGIVYTRTYEFNKDQWGREYARTWYPATGVTDWESSDMIRWCVEGERFYYERGRDEEEYWDEAYTLDEKGLTLKGDVYTRELTLPAPIPDSEAKSANSGTGNAVETESTDFLGTWYQKSYSSGLPGSMQIFSSTIEFHSDGTAVWNSFVLLEDDGSLLAKPRPNGISFFDWEPDDLDIIIDSDGGQAAFPNIAGDCLCIRSNNYYSRSPDAIEMHVDGKDDVYLFELADPDSNILANLGKARTVLALGRVGNYTKVFLSWNQELLIGYVEGFPFVLQYESTYGEGGYDPRLEGSADLLPILNEKPLQAHIDQAPEQTVENAKISIIGLPVDRPVRRGTTSFEKNTIRYISQSKYNKLEYVPEIWDFKDSSAGCYISAISMAISSLGYDLLPKQIISNDGGKSMYVDNYLNAIKIDGEQILKIESLLCVQENIDIMLERFRTNQSRYSPPLIQTDMIFTKEDPDDQTKKVNYANSHMVVVLGIDEQTGCYHILDSSYYNNALGRVVNQLDLTKNRVNGGEAQMVLRNTVKQYYVP